MFEDVEEAMQWLDDSIAERLEHNVVGNYPVVADLHASKLYGVKDYKNKPSEKVAREAFDLAQEAIQKSMGLLKVWDWDYDDYEKDAKADDREPSESDYADLMQIYTDDFIDEEFDEDLKSAMERARDWEWRDEYDFKHKMNQYLKDLSAFEDEYGEVVIDEQHYLFREVFGDE